jgi:diadenosine tetraphosphate (Ap4A) HIT family hydrolase
MTNDYRNERQMNCPICSWSPNDEDYLFITETQYWRICLAPNQSLLGRCVIHLKRHAGGLAELTEEEWNDFLNVVKRVEQAVKSAFNATMFNWSCYVNHAYRENPPAPHVHWWAVPRYAQAVRFGEKTFEDPHFGNPYDHGRKFDLPKNLRDEIAEKIRKTYNRANLIR